jgi:glutathione-regulated potassium-efflux system ancillary protein KefG
LSSGTDSVKLGSVARSIDPDDLIDAVTVAELLGLASRSSVSVYQKRYQDMPRPIIDLGQGRSRLWSRKEVLAWANANGRVRMK